MTHPFRRWPNCNFLKMKQNRKHHNAPQVLRVRIVAGNFWFCVYIYSCIYVCVCVCHCPKFESHFIKQERCKKRENSRGNVLESFKGITGHLEREKQRGLWKLLQTYLKGSRGKWMVQDNSATGWTDEIEIMGREDNELRFQHTTCKPSRWR